jgi:hypothetical protein
LISIVAPRRSRMMNGELLQVYIGNTRKRRNGVETAFCSVTLPSDRLTHAHYVCVGFKGHCESKHLYVHVHLFTSNNE